ncbi:MAG: hypothetical protein WB699_07740 [Bacteroidota bacterium]
MNIPARTFRVIPLTILFFLLVVCCHPMSAQVVIKERVSIHPGVQKRAYLVSEDTGAVWCTPAAGRIVVDGGQASLEPCNIAEIVVLQPAPAVICNSNPLDTLPGNWRSGTAVAMILIDNPGTGQTVYYPDSVSCYIGWGKFHYGFWYSSAWIIPGTDFDHFRVEVQPDTIAYGDTAKILVTAVDHGNQEVELEGSTQLTISIDSTQFGVFLDPSGNPEQSPLSGISYDDAKAGRLHFVANGERRDGDSLRVGTVRVTQSSDTSRTGTGSLAIVDTISVEIIDPEAGIIATKTISTDPAMPVITARARLKGREVLPSNTSGDLLFGGIIGHGSTMRKEDAMVIHKPILLLMRSPNQ